MEIMPTTRPVTRITTPAAIQPAPVTSLFYILSPYCNYLRLLFVLCAVLFIICIKSCLDLIIDHYLTVAFLVV